VSAWPMAQSRGSDPVDRAAFRTTAPRLRRCWAGIAVGVGPDDAHRRWPPRSAPKTCSGSGRSCRQPCLRVRAHVQDLRQSLKAEEAQEQPRMQPDGFPIRSPVAVRRQAARLRGMKFSTRSRSDIYAKLDRLPPGPTSHFGWAAKPATATTAASTT
jgi:hypothetical protein